MALEPVLASSSARRVELLAQLGLQVAQRPADIDESVLAQESVEAYVSRLAKAKAQAVVCQRNEVIIAADTAIAIDGLIIGKPANFDQFAGNFARMAAARHSVWTGVAVRDSRATYTALCQTNVWMRPVLAAELRAYWDSGEPAGKAGGYAIQGLGATFVSRIDGSYSNVVGLPLFETAGLLEQAGLGILSGVSVPGDGS